MALTHMVFVSLFRCMQEDLLSVWNRSSADYNCTTRIRDTLRRVLNLPPNTPMEYKSHNDSLKYIKTVVPQNVAGAVSPATSSPSSSVAAAAVTTTGASPSNSTSTSNNVYTPPSARGGGNSTSTAATSRFFSRPSFASSSHS